MKKTKKKKIENCFWDKKELLLKKENKALKQHKRLSKYHKILTGSVECFPLEQKENFAPKKQIIFKNTRDFVLGGQWITNIFTPENLM